MHTWLEGSKYIIQDNGQEDIAILNRQWMRDYNYEWLIGKRESEVEHINMFVWMD